MKPGSQAARRIEVGEWEKNDRFLCLFKLLLYELVVVMIH
jgi:hypothetical protein